MPNPDLFVGKWTITSLTIIDSSIRDLFLVPSLMEIKRVAATSPPEDRIDWTDANHNEHVYSFPAPLPSDKSVSNFPVNLSTTPALNGSMTLDLNDSEKQLVGNVFKGEGQDDPVGTFIAAANPDEDEG